MLNNRISRDVLYVLLACAGTVLIFLNTWKYGIGITDDSLNYIFSGTNLYLLKGFFSYDGSAFISWPPLYSTIIFLISLLSSDVYFLLIIFNSIVYFISVILLGKMGERIFTVPEIKVIFTSTIALSFQMLYIYTRAWSETIFITLSILTILLIIQNPVTNKSTIIILILLSLCILTRYLGLALVIAYYIYMESLGFTSNYNRSTHRNRTLIYCLIAIIPVLIWLTRNLLIANNLTRLNLNSIETIQLNIFQLLYYTTSLFIPESFNTNIRIAIFMVSLSVFTFLYIKCKISCRIIGLLLLFIITYTSILLLLSGILKFDNISYRFVIPVYFAMLIIFIYLFEYLIMKSKKTIFKILFWILLGGTFIYPIEKGLKHTYLNFKNGIEGYHSKRWVESETIAYINSYLNKADIYSNSIAGIYANTGLKANRISQYQKGGINGGNSVQIIFNEYLPGIDTIPDLSNSISSKDSVINFNDSYIIIKRIKE